MYLAPLNYDRFFRKVFSDANIARRFFEDFLDVKISKLNILPSQYSMIDETPIVELNFFCLIKSAPLVVKLHQWSQSDVEQLFCTYNPLAPNMHESINHDGKKLPTISIIWLVHAKPFDDDYMKYGFASENLMSLFLDDELWKPENFKKLLKMRNELTNRSINKPINEKRLGSKRLIYVSQQNVIRNKKSSKYYNWFEFAQKTLEKVADKSAYDKYRKDKIFCEVINYLESSLKESDCMEYIKNYEKHQKNTED